jgi:uncharacterized protein (DUF362 family)
MVETSVMDPREQSRRQFLPISIAATNFGCSAGTPPDGPVGNSAVFVAKAASYGLELARLVETGFKACGLNVRGRKVLLKPNLVEFDAQTTVNTNVAVLAGVLEACRRQGAVWVRIGEGPGHRRDTIHLAEQARYRGSIERFDDLFTDLNRDDVQPVEGFAGRDRFYFPQTALEADLIISVAKMKTHHWAGATLSMKNLFGLVPGAVYGWPKNILHNIGIPRSIVELNRKFRNTFAVVDGIVGMQGNGPIQGTPIASGVLAMGADVVAVDATCCRIMGIDPLRLRYLQQASSLGHTAADRIEQRGEPVEKVRMPFALIEEFRDARQA